MNHYVAGVQRPDQLDPNLAKHPGPGVPLSLEDRDALVAFLKTLTDSRYAKDDRTGPTLLTLNKSPASP